MSKVAVDGGAWAVTWWVSLWVDSGAGVAIAESVKRKVVFGPDYCSFSIDDAPLHDGVVHAARRDDIRVVTAWVRGIGRSEGAY